MTDLIVEYLDPNLVRFIKAEEEAKNQEKKQAEMRIESQIKENEDNFEITKQLVIKT